MTVRFQFVLQVHKDILLVNTVQYSYVVIPVMSLAQYTDRKSNNYFRFILYVFMSLNRFHKYCA